MKVVMLKWLGFWVSAWLDVACGLISVVTLCAYRPWWDFSFRSWHSKLMLKKERKEMKTSNKSAHYRKINDRSQASSTYHKKDGTPVRAIMNEELINEIDEAVNELKDEPTRKTK